MRNRTYWALGVLVLLILVVGVFYLVGKPSVEVADTVDTSSAPEQVDAGPILKAPPLGETFMTGYWDGDKWHRTAPPEPATVMYEGEAIAFEEFSRFAHRDGRGNQRPWGETVAILNLLIAAAPYSDKAYHARMTLARHDENGEWIWGGSELFDRLQPLVAYYPDRPALLGYLLQSGNDIYPEAAIHYGTEALKYVDMYPINSGYGAYPEQIHYSLGYAYQKIGDYSKALEHYRQTVELLNAYPGRYSITGLKVLAAGTIDAILSGNPPHGPLSQKDRSVVSGLPVAAPVASESVSASPALPVIQPGAPLLDVREGDDDAVVSDESPNADVAARNSARQQAQQRYEQAVQMSQAEQKRFESFVQQLHQVATIKTEADFEKFLMQELVKQLRRSDTTSSQNPAVSADRMRRASSIFRKAQTPAEGLKKLREVDPDLANTLHRVRR